MSSLHDKRTRGGGVSPCVSGALWKVGRTQRYTAHRASRGGPKTTSFVQCDLLRGHLGDNSRPAHFNVRGLKAFRPRAFVMEPTGHGDSNPRQAPRGQRSSRCRCATIHTPSSGLPSTHTLNAGMQGQLSRSPHRRLQLHSLDHAPVGCWPLNRGVERVQVSDHL